MKNRPAIISVHDVMPETLSQVETLLGGVLSDLDKGHILLLVVPGLSWQPEQIQQLRQWQVAGYELAGHGWVHEVRNVRGLYHRLHSFFISRRAAEHLSYSEAERLALLQRNHDWFVAQGFAPPLLYVPPAWALGSMSRQSLARQPYRFFETTAGLYDSEQRRFVRLPLAGFEADTFWRAAFLRRWNRFNQRLASQQRPLRIAIHPFDMQLHIADQLTAMVRQSDSLSWQSLFRGDQPLPAVRSAAECTEKLK